MNHSYKFLASSALLLLMPALALSDQSINETLSMAADGQVEVNNLAGTVEIGTWDKAQVEIRGELGDEVEELEITESSNGIRIRVRNNSERHNIDDTDIYLRIPVTASVEVETVSADIRVDGSSGKMIRVNTVSGDVELSGSPAQLDIHSVSGDMEFDGNTSRTSAESVSGEITLQGLSGEIAVKTVSGDMSLTAKSVSQAQFEAVSGDMKLDLAVDDGGRLTGESMSGDLVLRLPATQKGDFSAQTFSGDIRSDFGTAASVSRGPGSVLKYSEGSNGATIRLGNFSGDIHIRRQ